MFLYRCLLIAALVLPLSMLTPQPLQAVSAPAMIDIAPGFIGEGSNPLTLVMANERVFFTADDGIHGRELWVSQTTTGGVRLVADITEGAQGSFNEQDLLVTASGLVFFAPLDGQAGIWRSNGTAEGTFPLSPAPITSFAVFGDTLFFAVGRGLWRSDGTAEGTRAVKTFDTAISTLVASKTVLYLEISSDSRNSSLWASDGSFAGTALIFTGGSIVHFVPVDQRLFFVANTGVGTDPFYTLWATDGTIESTVVLHNFADYNWCGPMLGQANRFFFQDRYDLWVSDGTLVGTRLVSKGVLAFCASSTMLGDTLLFVGREEQSYNNELWRSDGTAEGTLLASDIYSGTTGSYPELLGVVDGKVFFTADDGRHGRELWLSDGTNQETRLVRDIYPGERSSDLRDNSSFLQPFGVAAGAALIFAANDGQSGYELWRSDGSAEGTALLGEANLNRLPRSSNPSTPLALSGRSVFLASSYEYGRELWVSNGTIAGTAPLDLTPGPFSSFSDGYWALGGQAIVNDQLFFIKSGALDNFIELWITDGTVEGSKLVKAFERSISSIHKLGSRAVFAIDDTLWSSDGTPAGTQPFWSEGDGSDTALRNIIGLGLLNDRLYFTVNSPNGTSGLWVSDGTNAGTLQINSSVRPYEVTATKNRLFFLANDAQANKSSLWVSDGSAEGTIQLRSSEPYKLLVAGNSEIYFTEYWRGNCPPYAQIWRTDGTTERTFTLVTYQLEYPECTFKTEFPLDIAASIGTGLYFTRDGFQLWYQDDVNNISADPKLIYAFLPPEPEENNFFIAPYKLRDQLLFTPNDGIHGTELWASDGTEEGTRLLHDLRLGPDSSSPYGYAVVNEQLFFSANDGLNGRELWVMPITVEDFPFTYEQFLPLTFYQ